MLFHGTWWMPTMLTFTHPDYPNHRRVNMVNQGHVDGPTAIIRNATIALIDATHSEIRTVGGDLVAIYEPTETPRLCGLT